MKGIEPIAMLTAYTCPIARYLEKSGVPIILVGDTVGMVEMGVNSTCHVTMDHMQYHVAAVRRGAPHTHIIGDLPYQSYESPESALNNARLLVEAGADSVKLEGPHIKEILEVDVFLSAEWFEVEADGEDYVHWCVQYRVKDRTALETYFVEHADRLRGDGLERFGGRFTAERRILSRSASIGQEISLY